MRTEAEVKEAIAHLREAVSAQVRGFPTETAMAKASIDMLRWVLGDTDTRFQQAVIDPCRKVDRAERQ